MKSLLAILIAMSLLAGCSDTSKAIERAKAEANPADALAIIRMARAAHCEDSTWICNPPEALD